MHFSTKDQPNTQKAYCLNASGYSWLTAPYQTTYVAIKKHKNEVYICLRKYYPNSSSLTCECTIMWFCY